MILLDTHAFVWLVSDQKKLSRKAISTLEENASALFISSITALEIALLVKRKRLKLPKPPAEFFEIALPHHGIDEIPVDREIALASVALRDLHNDPFDRILVATASCHGLAILSKDERIRHYSGVETLWA
jgi:PIN domain nuclease of toxin-antitoxin system